MIRTFITPTQSNYNVALVLPEDYLGEELEVIIFKKQEGLVTEKKPNPIKLSDKYRGVFSKEDAKSFNEHTQQTRKEWDSI
ncbi:MAG: hypothetical protein SNJ77_10370 [Cytophagales bacterium]